MKKVNKVVIIVLLVMVILSAVTISYGFGLDDLSGTQKEIETLKKAGNGIVKVISTIGVVTSVVVLIVIGIKYMMGSTSAKAEYKKTLIPYVIGAGLVFIASSIAQVIYDLAIKM